MLYIEKMPVICNDCGKQFKFPYLLKKHRSRKSSCSIVRPVEMKLACNSCPKIFDEQHRLNEHIKRKHSAKCFVEETVCKNLDQMTFNKLLALRFDTIDMMMRTKYPLESQLALSNNTIPKLLNIDNSDNILIDENKMALLLDNAINSDNNVTNITNNDNTTNIITNNITNNITNISITREMLDKGLVLDDTIILILQQSMNFRKDIGPEMIAKLFNEIVKHRIKHDCDKYIAFDNNIDKYRYFDNVNNNIVRHDRIEVAHRIYDSIADGFENKTFREYPEETAKMNKVATSYNIDKDSVVKIGDTELVHIICH